jgi:hypothetical protein
MEQNFYKSIISIEEATEKFHQGIAQGLYGPLYKLRMLQFNPRVCSIEEDTFQFGMFKHYGVFRAFLSPEIAAHWGIKLPLKKNCLNLSHKKYLNRKIIQTTTNFN